MFVICQPKLGGSLYTDGSTQPFDRKPVDIVGLYVPLVGEEYLIADPSALRLPWGLAVSACPTLVSCFVIGTGRDLSQSNVAADPPLRLRPRIHRAGMCSGWSELAHAEISR